MITRLVAAGQTELLWIGYALAAKVMKHDLHWLRRMFSMLGDFLRDSPVYQEVLEEGVEKGRQEGMIEAQRQILFDIVFERFPEIIHLARQQANAVHDTEILRHLTVKMSTVQNPKEAEQYLLTATGDTLKN